MVSYGKKRDNDLDPDEKVRGQRTVDCERLLLDVMNQLQPLGEIYHL